MSFYIKDNFQEIEGLEEKKILKDNRAPIELLREFDKIPPL